MFVWRPTSDILVLCYKSENSRCEELTVDTLALLGNVVADCEYSKDMVISEKGQIP